MPRYIKQRDKYRCGPVAILNSLKWAGVAASYSEHTDCLTELAVCGPPPRGTCHGTFDRALRVAGKGFYSVRRVFRPYLGEIEDHLRGGGAIVHSYAWKIDKEDRWGRHFQLLVGISPSGKSLYTVNRAPERSALHRILRKTFKRDDLRFQRVDPCYKAWFLTKI